MSMLTPQGLKGKQYRITGNAYPRLGRPPKKSRKVIAALAALLALALIGLGGVQLYDIFSGKNKNASAQACATPSGKPLAAPARVIRRPPAPRPPPRATRTPSRSRPPSR